MVSRLSTLPFDRAAAKIANGEIRMVSCASTRILDQDQYKARLKRSWVERGSSYDQSDHFRYKFAHELVSAARIKKGWHVLDLCTGTGTAALDAAEIVDSDGRVVGVDIAETMLAKVKHLLPGHLQGNIHIYHLAMRAGPPEGSSKSFEQY